MPPIVRKGCCSSDISQLWTEICVHKVLRVCAYGGSTHRCTSSQALHSIHAVRGIFGVTWKTNPLLIGQVCSLHLSVPIHVDLICLYMSSNASSSSSMPADRTGHACTQCRRRCVPVLQPLHLLLPRSPFISRTHYRLARKW